MTGRSEAMRNKTGGSGLTGYFEPLRPRLIRIAYRMLGSVGDAEDVVQEAFLRWLDVDPETIREPEAYLRRVVTRLCLDQLKSARRQRETYLGPWLPEPIVDESADALDDITLPLMLALERLSPLERATFLLHDIFGVSFEEIATTIGRKPAACRQLASRARKHVRQARPRFPIVKQDGLRLAEAFFRASRAGDLEGLRRMLADDVVVYADGGGKVAATAVPVRGITDVLDLHASLADVFAETMSRLLRFGFIDGLPGFISMEQDDVLQTTALAIEDGKIVAIYVTRNPEKLEHLRGLVQ